MQPTNGIRKGRTMFRPLRVIEDSFSLREPALNGKEPEANLPHFRYNTVYANTMQRAVALQENLHVAYDIV